MRLTLIGLCIAAVLVPFAYEVLAFQSSLSYEAADGKGARFIITIIHSDPIIPLTYGLLLPLRTPRASQALVIRMDIRDAISRKILPFANYTCDINYEWYGNCERALLGIGGGTTISVFFSNSSLEALDRMGIEKGKFLLKSDAETEPVVHEFSVSELIKKSRELKTETPTRPSPRSAFSLFKI